MHLSTLLLASAASKLVQAAPAPQDDPVPAETSDEPVFDPNGTVSIESTLWFPGGSGCDSDTRKAVAQAYKDALRLAAAVQHPELILGHKPGDDTPHDAGSADYFGPEEDWSSISIAVTGNFRRANLPNDQSWLGDIWHGRYFTIRCDDPDKQKGKKGCSLGVRAYEIDPKDSDGVNTSDYPLINICVNTQTPFTALETLDKQIQNINDGLLPKDNVESLRSQGSTFLHEMYHTVAANYNGGQNAGVSQPKCQDKTMFGTKAYGAAKAKYLARSSSAGSLAAKINNDNYVYYTISRFMMSQFSVPYPSNPPAAWPRVAATNNTDDFWDSIDEDSDLNELPDGTQLSDDQLYGDGLGPELAELYCSNPSLEDGDGLCTCNQGGATTTVTPSGGPGNSCPTSIAGMPEQAPATTVPATTAAPTLGCSNPSLEDGDGIFTCIQGSVTTTVTPDGGPGNACPTSL